MSVQSFFNAQSGGSTDSNVRHSFRAGRLNAVEVRGGPTLRLTADERKGAIQLVKGADGLTYFRWMDRKTKVVSDINVCVVPGSATFKKIDTGREGDRCYLLQVDARRYFFWMQEPRVEVDEANCKRVTELIADPDAPAAGASGAAGQNEIMRMLGGGAAGGRGGGRGQQLREQLGQLAARNPAALQQLLGGLGGGAMMGGGAPADESSAPAPEAPSGGGFGDDDAMLQAALLASMGDASPSASGTNDGGDASGDNTGTGAGTTASGTASGSAGGSAAPSGSGGGDAAGDGSDNEDGADWYGEGGDDAGEQGGEGGDGSRSGGAAPPAPPATPAARDGTAPPLPAAGNAEATSAPAAGGAGGVTMEALAAALAAAADPSAFQPTPLTAVMDSSAILSLLDDEALVNRLLPLLPEGQQDVESLREIICSPQLRAGVAALGGALSTDNYQSVFANFGLNPADGADEMARGDGPGAFLSALQALVDRERAARSDGGETGAEEGGTGEGGAGGDGAGGDADME